MVGDHKPSALQVILQGIAVLAITAAEVWAMLPPDERMWIRLSLSQRLSSLRARAGGLAARQGHEGMGDELAGKARLARSRYGAAAAWSRLRDAIGRAAQVARP